MSVVETAAGSASLHAAVADIYGAVFTSPFGDFKAACLERLSAELAFDMAAWGSGVHSTNQLLSVSTLRLPLESLMTYAAHWQSQDFVRAAAAGAPGRAFRNEDVMELEAYHRTPIYLEYSRPAGIEHALGLVLTDEIADLGEMVFLFRSDPGSPFGTADAALLELMAPHLANAWKQAQIAHHMRAASGGLSGYAGFAVADALGVMHATGDQFSLAVRSALPGWTGPYLPDSLRGLVKGGGGAVRLPGWSFISRPSDGRFLLAVAETAGGEDLTPSEFRAASLYVEGKTQAQVARSLGVSPATVRNQLASVYRKLEVHSKIDLARALSRTR